MAVNLGSDSGSSVMLGACWLSDDFCQNRYRSSCELRLPADLLTSRIVSGNQSEFWPAFLALSLLKESRGNMGDQFDFDALVPTHDLARIYYETGKTLVEQKRYPEAFSAFEQALSKDSSNIETLNAALLTSVVLRNWQIAHELAESLLVIMPGHPNACITEGLYYQHQGQPEKAQNFFQRALIVDPTNKIARDRLRELLDCGFNENETNIERRYRRAPVSMGLFVNYFEDNRFQLEKLTYLGGGGGFVATPHPIEMGKEVSFMLPINGSKRIQGVGKAVWTGPKKPYGRGFGMEFKNITPADRSAIIRYVESRVPRKS